jgi:pimeloyl-ACP methyl ester carboxylesterase
MPDARPAVVIVHGLWTGRWAMGWLDRGLTAAGFRVFRFGYPSVRQGLQANAAALADFAAGIEAPQLHWLGHSLGGILIFRTLAGGGFSGGRVVMLGSPLKGSFAAAQLARFGIGRSMLGHSVLEWFSGPAPRWALPFDLGIIAGTRSMGLGRLVAPGLPRPNDGAICVEETRIPGAREHLALPVSHSGMLLSSRVARCAADFLKSGSFAGEGPAR